MLTTRVPLGSLIDFCRALRHMTESGLTLAQAMKQQGRRGPLGVQPVAARLAEKLERGKDLQSALRGEADAFPPLFVNLAGVAEEAGRLPDVLRELEDYFTLQLRLRRQFLGMIAWPVIQFVLAVFVIALVIWITGMLGGAPLFFGLSGGRGAVIFIVSVFGTLAAIAGALGLARRLLRGSAALDALLLHVPVLGPCLRALALSRFSMGLALTMEAGLPADEALRLSLRATDNDAFAAKEDEAADSARAGDEITLALNRTGLFPTEYLAIVETAEVSGQIPEVMQRQARHYADEAGRRMKALAGVTAGPGGSGRI